MRYHPPLMIAANLDHVSVTYLQQPIFRELSWEIHNDRCVGLVGPNGSGKSTLLKLIAGQVASDTGFVVRAKGLTVGYLQQEPQLEAGRTLLASVLTASEPLQRLEADLARIEERLVDPAIFADEKALARALDRQAHLLEEFEKLGGPGFEGRVRTTLRSLGFAEADFDLPVEALSGGQRKLAGLARLLVTQPDLLLLDEPSSGLDPEGQEEIQTYIEELRAVGKTILMSTHQLPEVTRVCTYLVILKDGEVLYQNRMAEALTLQPHIAIQVDRPLDAARPLLAMVHPDIAIEGQEVVLRNESIAMRRQILSVLINQGYDIVRVEQRRVTLAELYAEAVQ